MSVEKAVAIMVKTLPSGIRSKLRVKTHCTQSEMLLRLRELTLQLEREYPGWMVVRYRPESEFSDDDVHSID